MRSIPGMTVVCPSDAVEARAAVFAAYAHDGPVYLRFGRLAVPVINERPDYHFELGKGVTMREGRDVTIVANGLLVAEALEAAKALAAEGIDARVLNIHTIKPLDNQLILKAAKETGLLVTAEEHSVIGGLGEAVCALCAENCPVPVRRIGVNDEYGHSGPAPALLEQFGLCSAHIVEVVREAVKARRG